jgi:hypothetical protein
MQPVSFEGSREVKKPADMTDEQCMSIWAKRGFGALLLATEFRGQGVPPPHLPYDDNDGFTFYVTAWKPSYEDLQSLNRGEPIYIKTISNGLPPMAVFTLDENNNCNDAG